MKKISVLQDFIWQAPDDPNLFSVNVTVISKSELYLIISHNQIFYNCMSSEFVDICWIEPDIELTPLVQSRDYNFLDYIPDECIQFDFEDKELISEANELVERFLCVSSTLN